MARTIVATFDSRSEAERAAEFLAEEGFDRRHIDIRAEPWAETAGTRTGEREQSWWEWLFGESDDRAYYSDSLERGGALLAVTAPDDRLEYARDLLESRGVEVEESTSAETTTRRPEVAPERTSEGNVIPIAEERLRVGKRPVARGGVRVYTRVVEQPVEEQVRLQEEHVHVDRRPADRPVSAADEAFRERSIELTESAEEPVVAKDARVVEEVAIGKDVTERTETIRESVRRTDVDVEKLPGGSSVTSSLPRVDDPRFAEHEEDFHRHWRANLEEQGVPYERTRLAYAYGCDVAGDPRYAGRDWTTIEPELRHDWDREHPGTWEQFKNSVHYAWERMRGQRRAA